MDKRGFQNHIRQKLPVKSKYHNKKVQWRGEEFDSIREKNRYAELLLLQRTGQIRDLQRQTRFELIPTQKKPGEKTETKCSYIADFVYIENGQMVVEDCKGFRTEVYKIKRKLMIEKYGIWIKET